MRSLSHKWSFLLIRERARLYLSIWFALITKALV
jgi:hypothetical protein